jgi:hypothetical protein
LEPGLASRNIVRGFLSIRDSGTEAAMTSTIDSRLDSSRTEVVLVGVFKPDEVLPEALARSETITSKEASAAKFKNLLQGQIVEFEIDGVTVQVVPQRLVVHTTQVPYIRAADLALKIVREASPSSTVTMLGINREYQYKFANVEERDKFGIRIAPPIAWGEFGKVIEADQRAQTLNSEGRSGVFSITMRRMHFTDRESGWLDITVAATGTRDEPGVQIRANDHYQFHTKYDPESLVLDHHASSRTARLLDTFTKNFDESIKRSDMYVHGLWK